jgi:hypothetical protein
MTFVLLNELLPQLQENQIIDILYVRGDSDIDEYSENIVPFMNAVSKLKQCSVIVFDLVLFKDTEYPSISHLNLTKIVLQHSCMTARSFKSMFPSSNIVDTMKHLDLSGNNYFVVKDAIENISFAFPNLEELFISSCDVKEDCDSPHTSFMRQLLKSLKSLKVLDVSYCCISKETAPLYIAWMHKYKGELLTTEDIVGLAARYYRAT